MVVVVVAHSLVQRSLFSLNKHQYSEKKNEKEKKHTTGRGSSRVLSSLGAMKVVVVVVTRTRIVYLVVI